MASLFPFTQQEASPGEQEIIYHSIALKTQNLKSLFLLQRRPQPTPTIFYTMEIQIRAHHLHYSNCSMKPTKNASKRIQVDFIFLFSPFPRVMWFELVSISCSYAVCAKHSMATHLACLRQGRENYSVV